MARNRFVTPHVIRLPLSDGDWIDVKQELNAGEERAIFADAVKNMVAGQKTELDPEQVGKTKLIHYIVGWSFVDANGTPVPFSAAALSNLDTETYIEIVDAVDAHEDLIEKVRAERKNAKATGKESPATSVSAGS
jgi:hypothetical protein